MLLSDLQCGICQSQLTETQKPCDEMEPADGLLRVTPVNDDGSEGADMYFHRKCCESAGMLQ